MFSGENKNRGIDPLPWSLSFISPDESRPPRNYPLPANTSTGTASATGQNRFKPKEKGNGDKASENTNPKSGQK